MVSVSLCRTVQGTLSRPASQLVEQPGSELNIFGCFIHCSLPIGHLRWCRLRLDTSVWKPQPRSLWPHLNTRLHWFVIHGFQTAFLRKVGFVGSGSGSGRLAQGSFFLPLPASTRVTSFSSALCVGNCVRFHL